MKFAGRRSQATVASEVYLKLVLLAEALADKEYVKYFYEMKRLGDERRARGFRTSFLLGFCSRVDARYVEYVEAVRKYYLYDSKALMVLNQDKVDEWLKSQKIGLSKTKHKPTIVENLTGWRTGKVKADDVDFSPHKKLT